MTRVTTTLRQWCGVCQRVTLNVPCPLACGAQMCAECGDHGAASCPGADDDY